MRKVFGWVMDQIGHRLDEYDTSVFKELEPGLFLHKQALEEFDLHGKIVVVSSGKVCVLDLDSHKFVKLGPPEGDASLPVWSPGGQRLAYTQSKGVSVQHTRSIRIRSLDGSDQEIHSTGNMIETDVSWLRDGRHIVFASSEDGSNFRLCRAKSDGTQRNEITDTWGRYPHARMKDDLIVFRGPDGCLYTCNPSSRETARVCQLGNCYYPRWSPDGRLIAAMHRSETGPHDEVFLLEYESGVVRPLTYTEGRNAFPSWSDGRPSIVYSVAMQHEGSTNLWVIRLNRSSCLQLTHGIDLGQPHWSS
jgi:Tol biopolymer transport system component